MRVDLEKIKLLIKKSGMTQKELAEAFGITRVYFTNCLNGHQDISNKLVNAIAQRFGVSIDELYLDDMPTIDIPEGETFIQCPCCKSMIGISLKCAKIKDPEDPFADKKSCDI